MRHRSLPSRLRSLNPHRLAMVSLLVAAPASGQQDVQINLQHPTKTVTLSVGGNPVQSFRQGEVVRIPSGLPVRVALTNSNSALYSCKVSQEALAVPDLDTLKVFLSAIGGYLPIIARGIAGTGGPPPAHIRALDEAATRLGAELRGLDSLVDGSTGLRRARRQVVTSLSLMRLSPHTVDPDVPANLRRWFRESRRCLDEECSHLNYPAELLAAFDNVHLRAQALKRANTEAKRTEAEAAANATADGTQDGSRFSESFTAAKELVAAAEKALESSQTVLLDAYSLEKLAIRTMNATATVPCDVVEVSWDQGRTLTFNVAPVAGDELEPIATNEAFEYKMEVLPRWKIRPAVGLTFLMAPRAEYPTYSASQAEAGFRIVEDGVQDSRFTYGLTLGLTYGPLDRREESGWAAWVPELIVNPLDDVKAVGIGAGISYCIVKVGFGRLFTRHKVLNDQRVNDSIPSADALHTRETFGSGEWYVGISLIGLPPFVPGK